MAGGWKLQFTFYFMKRTHEPLHLVKWNFVHWKIMDIPISFSWIIIFFDGTFEYGDASTFWGYVGINAEMFYVKLCNFVQCHMFVGYLSCYC
jgi:hypothetical protein